jgi:ABC-type proline/glycine betaine transport system substrate-binding protein
MTNEWQGPMAKQVEIEGQKLEDVAKKWVDANPDKVNAWLAAG